MAQPLVPNAPAFSLCAFGSNNRFTYRDVQRRWRTLEQLAAENGIQIMGFSSDGDSRLLKTMRIKAQLPISKNEDQDDNASNNITDPAWFQANLNSEGPFCVQDTVHIGTRLRTRFLKPSIMLPIGRYIISPTYMISLMDLVTKDKHLLCPGDLKSEDKMNYDSVERNCAPHVLEMLEKIPDSRGTLAYLKIMRYVLDSFLSKDLTPLERVEKIWYAVFFLRIWRYWIKSMKYSGVDNFITLSTYVSIELNAHALILIIKKMHTGNPSEFCSEFCPWIMSSQPCEKIFRSTRSMTSTFSTVTNYSMLDILRRLTRIQAINEITCDTEKSMIYPRKNNRRLGAKELIEKSQQADNILPSWIQIVEKVSSVQQEVENDMRDLGIIIESRDWISMDVEVIHDSNLDGDVEMENEQTYTSEGDSGNSGNGVVDTETEELDNEMIHDLDILRSIDSEDALNVVDLSQKFSEKNDDFFESSPYVKVYNKNRRIVIRKSTLCWILSNKDKKMSSDRLQRVKFSVETKQNITDATSKLKQPIEAKKSLKIGEWVIFHISSKVDKATTNKTVSEPLSFIKIGKILSFKYLNKKTKKQQEYSLESAPVLSKNDKNVGVLCQWFLVNQEGDMTLDEGFKLFHEIGLYICSIGAPTLRGNSLSIDKKTLQGIVDRYLQFRNEEGNEDSSESDMNIIYDDSEDRETSNTSEYEDSPPPKAPPELEKYYAIFYEDNFYIGRAIKHIKTNISKFKFLKWDLDRLIWPKNEDLQEVDHKFILDGPISLTGVGPFEMKRNHFIELKKKFKQFKNIT